MANMLDTLFSPFFGWDIAATYTNASMIIDFILYLMFFLYVSRYALSKRFDGQTGKALSVVLGVVLAISMSFFGQRYGFTIGSLGPLAGLIFIAVLGIMAFNLLRDMGSNTPGAGAFAFLLVYFTILGIVPGFWKTIADSAPFIEGLFAVAVLIAVFVAIRALIQLFIPATETPFPGITDSAEWLQRQAQESARRREEAVKVERRTNAIADNPTVPQRVTPAEPSTASLEMSPAASPAVSQPVSEAAVNPDIEKLARELEQKKQELDARLSRMDQLNAAVSRALAERNQAESNVSAAKTEEQREVLEKVAEQKRKELVDVHEKQLEEEAEAAEVISEMGKKQAKVFEKKAKVSKDPVKKKEFLEKAKEAKTQANEQKKVHKQKKKQKKVLKKSEPAKVIKKGAGPVVKKENKQRKQREQIKLSNEVIRLKQILDEMQHYKQHLQALNESHKLSKKWDFGKLDLSDQQEYMGICSGIIKRNIELNQKIFLQLPILGTSDKDFIERLTIKADTPEVSVFFQNIVGDIDKRLNDKKNLRTLYMHFGKDFVSKVKGKKHTFIILGFVHKFISILIQIMKENRK